MSQTWWNIWGLYIGGLEVTENTNESNIGSRWLTNAEMWVMLCGVNITYLSFICMLNISKTEN